MMKRVLLFTAMILLITGCNISNSIKERNEGDYYLTYNNYDLRVGNDFDYLLALVGPYNNVRAEASSYYDGIAHVYEYDDFEVETFFEHGIEKIYSINITNDNIVTNEGLHLNSTKHEMIVAYGLGYKTPFDNIYTYNHSNSNITFIMNDDIITNIKYYLE